MIGVYRERACTGESRAGVGRYVRYERISGRGGRVAGSATSGYDEAKRTETVALYGALGNYQAVHRRTGIARSTIRRWVEEAAKSARDDGALGQGQMMERTAAARRDDDAGAGRIVSDGRGAFVETAQGAMEDALRLVWRQIRTALSAQQALETLLEGIMSDDQTPQKERTETAKAIAKMGKPDIKELMGAVVTLYEKLSDAQERERPGAELMLGHLSTEDIRALLAECEQKA